MFDFTCDGEARWLVQGLVLGSSAQVSPNDGEGFRVPFTVVGLGNHRSMGEVFGIVTIGLARPGELRSGN